jgi:hypothetical protein
MIVVMMLVNNKINYMEAPDFGPDWFWYLLFIVALVGIIASVVWVIKAIIWLFNHVQFN